VCMCVCVVRGNFHIFLGSNFTTELSQPPLPPRLSTSKLLSYVQRQERHEREIDYRPQYRSKRVLRVQKYPTLYKDLASTELTLRVVMGPDTFRSDFHGLV
jgi:hypothetical protein